MSSATPHASDSSVTEVSRLELFFDLVFVFTITQFTRSVMDHPTLVSVGQATVMLSIVWWMYGGYAWLTNLVAPDCTSRRVVMVASMVSYLVLALAVPTAFQGDGLAFALAYLLVVMVHGGLFVASTGRVRGAITRGFFPLNTFFSLVLIAGGWLGGTAQDALWTATAVGVWVVPRIVPDQSYVVGATHFVERHALVVIVALGESVVAVGIAASHEKLGVGLLDAVGLAMAVTACLWWSYFGANDDERREEALVRSIGIQRKLVVVRSFGLPFVGLLGGVVLVAAGLHHAVTHPFDATGTAYGLYLGAGAGLFLVADQASRFWLGMGADWSRLAMAVAAIATAAVGVQMNALAQMAMLVGVLLAGFTVESRLAATART